MYPLLHIIASILPSHPKGPMCRIDQAEDEADGEDANWASLPQRALSLKELDNTKGWLRFSTDYESFASSQVIKRHKYLLKTSAFYRGLDIISHLFGAYDSRIPREHRGGMIKVHKMFGK